MIMENRIIDYMLKLMTHLYKLVLLCFIFIHQAVDAQGSFVMEDSLSKHKISFSQGTDVSLINTNTNRRYLLFGNNLKGGNIDFAINYHYRRKSGKETIISLIYTYDRDIYTYYNHYLDEYGLSKIKLNAHLICFEIGNKFYSKKMLTKLNLYSTFSASISLSLYRKNDVQMPGLDHYQEFKGLHFSHFNIILGKGIELPTYKNQYFMTELGLRIPLPPTNNHSNLVYSLDIYFKVGYGFTF